MQVIQPSETGTILPVTVQYILDHLEALKDNAVPVYRALKKTDGTMQAQRVDPALAKDVAVTDRQQKLFLLDRDWQKKLFEAADSFEAQLEPLLEMTPQARAEAVSNLKTVIGYLKLQETPPMVKAQAIMNTVSQTFLLNKASLKLKPAEVTGHERALAKDSESIISTAVEMADDPLLVEGLFASFQSLSNGQTINHILRVFATFSGFLKYYNVQHQQRFSQNLRRVFPKAYKAAYKVLLPHLEESKLTSDNLLQFPFIEPHDIKEFALGAFLHDIGKMGNLDYFESDSAYDPVQIRQHVYLSSGLILMNYGNEHDKARLLAGDHHNALGHTDGYSVSRLEREKGMRAPKTPERVITSQSEEYSSGFSLGFLPVEMLAVCDVYDAMIDDSRTYKKAMSTDQACRFLEDQMVKGRKLDPVLVDLYIDFLRAAGVEVPADRGFAFKFSQQ